MKAVRLFDLNDVRVVTLEKPEPKAGEVLIKIGGAGVCHSDLHVIHSPFKGQAPFTLGHENAGWVEALGQGVTGYNIGDAVMVYGPWGCGHCKPCQNAQENYCDHQHELGALGGGLYRDGGMAEYMIVPSARLLVPLGDLAPAQAAPLTDAALTPYHAIKRSLDKLTPDAFVVVIGIGGLGHMALQILKALASATVIACDIGDDKLKFALSHGADYAFDSTSSTVDTDILALTGSKKAAVVFDFVGANPTFALGQKLVGLNSDWTVCGLAGDSFSLSAATLPFGCSMSIPYWGSRTELIEVIALANQGIIKAEVTQFKLSEALMVYEKLEQGQIQGRAVLVP